MTGDAGSAARSDPSPHLPDAALTRWPAALRPYVELARIDRPIGWQLLLAPCWWGTALVDLALRAPPHPLHHLLFAVGAVAMPGAPS